MGGKPVSSHLLQELCWGIVFCGDRHHLVVVRRQDDESCIVSVREFDEETGEVYEDPISSFYVNNNMADVVYSELAQYLASMETRDVIFSLRDKRKSIEEFSELGPRTIINKRIKKGGA